MGLPDVDPVEVGLITIFLVCGLQAPGLLSEWASCVGAEDEHCDLLW